MRILVVMTSVGAGILASSAFAADVSIKGGATEALEASNNYFLINTPSGPTIKSLTAGTLDILARTPTTNFLLDTNYSYYKYSGPGAADTSLQWGTPASATFSVDHTEQLTKYNAAASWSRSDAATTNLAQTGNAVGRGSIETAAINGGITHDLGRNDVLTWTAQLSKVTFTDPTQFPYIDVVSTAAWQHTVSPTTTINNSVSFDWFSEDNPAQSQRLFWRIMTGIDSKLTPRLSFVGHVGVGLVNSYQTGGQSTSALNVNNINPPELGIVTSTVGVVPFQPQVGTATSILADLALSYQLLKTTSLSLTAAQAVVPTSFGQLQKSDSIGIALAHNINQLSRLSFSAGFSFIPATQGNSIFTGQTGSSEFFSASVGYSYQLAREWRSNLSYTYRERNDSSGIARSSTVLFSLARDFTLLGNPTAINQAEKERARERERQNIGYIFPGLQ